MTPQDLASFVQYEARLIDEQRFDEWLDLFAEDGRYWMPLEYGRPIRCCTTRCSTTTSCCSASGWSG